MSRVWWLAFVLLIAPATMFGIFVAWVGVFTLLHSQMPALYFPHTRAGNALASQGHAISEVWGMLPRTLFPPRWTPWVTIFVVGSVLYPATLLCLPWTRAKSKVHSRHVARAAVYSFAPLLVVMLVFFLTKMYDSIVAPIFPMYGSTGAPSWYDPFSKHPDMAASFDPTRLESQLIVLLSAWQFLFWLFALRSGFRMTDWRRVLLAIAAPSLIAQGFLVLMLPVM